MKILLQRKILLLFFLVFTLNAHGASLRQSVELQSTAGLGYHSKELPVLNYFRDNIHLFGTMRAAYLLESVGSPWVKGLLKTDISSSTGSGLLLELSRAFIRSRIPVGPQYVFQLELGKNQLAWGTGTYYNAGDVIFGVQPKTLSLVEGLARDFSFWHLRFLFPLSSFSYIETVVGLPEQKIELDSNGNKILLPQNFEELGAGMRLHVGTEFLDFETGAYYRANKNSYAPYLSVTLPLLVKFYVAASSTFAVQENENYAEQFSSTAAVSAGLLYLFSVNKGGSWQLTMELLYQNKTYFLQPGVLWKINKELALQLFSVISLDSTDAAQAYTVIIGPKWTPVPGFTLSVFSNTDITIDSSADEAVRTGISLDLRYKF